MQVSYLIDISRKLRPTNDLGTGEGVVFIGDFAQPK